MKILFYGDLQVNFANAEYMSFMERTMNTLEQLVEEEKPDLLINLGDTTDTFGTVSVKDLVWAHRRLKRLSALMRKHTTGPASMHWILMGNHDVSDHACEYSTTELMEGADCIPFTKPVVNAYGLGVNMFPFTEDMDEVRGLLPDCKGTICSAGHIDWLGAKVTPTFVSTSGLDVAEYAEITNHVPFFQGHYHMPSDTPPLYVVGSPLHKDFNDDIVEIPRGFTWYDSDEGHISRIQNFNTYYTIKVKADSEEEVIRQYLAVMNDPGAITRTKVRIYCPSSAVEYAKEVFSSALSCSVIPTDTGKSDVDHAVAVSLTTPVGEVVNHAVEAADSSTYDRETLMKYGREVFEQ
jgi:hypothetical protein